eukprot:gene4572-7956_t
MECGSILLFKCKPCDEWYRPKEFYLHQKENGLKHSNLFNFFESQNNKKQLKIDNLKDYALKFKNTKEVCSKNLQLVSVYPKEFSIDEKYKTIEVSIRIKDENEFYLYKFPNFKLKIGYQISSGSKKELFVDVLYQTKLKDGNLIILETSNFPFSLIEREVTISVICEMDDETLKIGPPIYLKYSKFKRDQNKQILNLSELEINYSREKLSKELMIAIEETLDTGCLCKLLLKVKDWKNSLNFTILNYFSCFDDKNETLERILKTKIFDVNEKTVHGKSSLFYAKKFGCTKNEESLLKYGSKLWEDDIFVEKITSKKLKKKSQLLSSGNSELIKIIPGQLNSIDFEHATLQLFVKYIPISMIPEKYFNARFWRVVFSEPFTGDVICNLEINCLERINDFFIISVLKIPRIQQKMIHISAEFAEKNRLIKIGPKIEFIIQSSCIERKENQ